LALLLIAMASACREAAFDTHVFDIHPEPSKRPSIRMPQPTSPSARRVRPRENRASGRHAPCGAGLALVSAGH
jgi:hypothetical protein